MKISEFRQMIRQQAKKIIKQKTIIQDVNDFKTKIIQKIEKTINQMDFSDITPNFTNEGAKKTAINNVKLAFTKLIKENKFQLYKNQKN